MTKELLFVVGASGVGKTTFAASLAAKLYLDSNQKRRTMLVCADNYRVGAYEQLNKLACIIGIDCVKALNPLQLASIEFEHDEIDTTIVDMESFTRGIKELKKYTGLNIDGLSKNVYLLLSASTKYSDMKHQVDMCKELVEDFNLVVTKINETDNLTDVAKLIDENNYYHKIAYVSMSADIPDCFTSPEHCMELTRAILGRRYDNRGFTK